MNISENPDAGRRNRKRATDCLMDDAESNNEPHSKISKLSTNGAAIYIKLAEEDKPERVCDSDDSTYDSFHGRETDLCRDTSDTDSNYSSGEERSISMAVVEYEIASSDDSDGTDALSSSGTDDFMIAAVAQAIYDESSSSPSDFSLFADTEDSDSTSDDPELGKADYWECVKCKNRQNNPLYRYCEKCYQIRKNLFPPRPKKNRKTRLSPRSGIMHKAHHREDNTEFGSKSKHDFSYVRENSMGKTVSKVKSLTSKEANSAGESGKSDDSDNEYHNDKIINFLNKSPKMCKRRKRLSNRKLTNNTTKQDHSSELGEASKKIIVLLNNSSTTTSRLTDPVPNAINVNQQSSSTNSTDSSNNNNNPDYSIKLSSQISNRKRTCDLNNSIDEDVANELVSKRFRLDSLNEVKTFHNKMFKNVIENWSGNSDTDTGDTIKLTPPNQLDLIGSCNKDSGFSSCSSQELSPTVTTNDVDNSSQETYCPELEIDETRVTEVYATSSTELSTLSETSAKIGLLSRSESSCSDFIEIVSALKSQDSIERSQNSEGFEMCMMCLTEPKNGVFVHNRFLHSCCCYKCAMKVWAKLKRCPICNCKVKNVMKLFVH